VKYLVVYPSQTGQTEEKEMLADAGEAKEYIERILLSGNVSEEQVEIYEANPVDFQVARVPVVKIGDEAELPKMNIADIPAIITTEEDVAAEESLVPEAEETNQFVEESETEEDNVEVFTFDN